VLKSIIDEAFRRTITLLRAQRDVLDRGAHRLLEHETLDEADLAALRAPEPAPAG
jgi:cell division protease FtsH